MDEVRKTVVAGGQQFVDAAGDFIFCSFADRPFRIIIDGQPVTARVGDKLRPEKRFRNFIIENLDDDNPIAVRLVVGEGDYNSQIIQGEVTVNPGVRNSAGQFIPDSRFDVSLMATLTSRAARDYQKGDTVFEFEVEDAGSGGDHSIYGAEMIGPDEILLTVKTQDLEPEWLAFYSRDGVSRGVIDFKRIYSGESGGSGGISDRIVGIEFNTARNTVMLLTRGGEFYEVTRAGTVIEYADLSGVLPDGYAAGAATGLAYSPERNELAIVTPINDSLVIIDRQTMQEKKTFQVAPYNDGDVSTWGGKWFLMGSGSGSDGILDPESGEIEPVSVLPGNTDAGCVWEHEGFAVIAVGLTVKAICIEDTKFYGAGEAHAIECGKGARLMRRPSNPLKAEIYAHLEGGFNVATGEIIRATIEMWTGHPAPDDYLDHVYGIEMPGQTVIAKSGAETFKRAGIEDWFTAKFPGRVTLTIDNQLLK